jgi:hypothetical protein
MFMSFDYDHYFVESFFGIDRKKLISIVKSGYCGRYQEGEAYLNKCDLFYLFVYTKLLESGLYGRKTLSWCQFFKRKHAENNTRLVYFIREGFMFSDLLIKIDEDDCVVINEEAFQIQLEYTESSYDFIKREISRYKKFMGSRGDSHFVQRLSAAKEKIEDDTRSTIADLYNNRPDSILMNSFLVFESTEDLREKIGLSKQSLELAVSKKRINIIGENKVDSDEFFWMRLLKEIGRANEFNVGFIRKLQSHMAKNKMPPDVWSIGIVGRKYFFCVCQPFVYGDIKIYDKNRMLAPFCAKAEKKVVVKNPLQKNELELMLEKMKKIGGIMQKDGAFQKRRKNAGCAE